MSISDIVFYVWVIGIFVFWVPISRGLIRLVVGSDIVTKVDIAFGTWLGFVIAFAWPLTAPGAWVTERLKKDFRVSGKN